MGHPIVTNRIFWQICAKVHEAMELPFGVVSGVGPHIGILEGRF